MDNNEKNLEAIELNEEVLEQASGGSYGNPMNLKGLGTGCVPGGTYVDRNCVQIVGDLPDFPVFPAAHTWIATPDASSTS